MRTIVIAALIASATPAAGEVVGIVNADTVRVTCKGTGPDAEAAALQARKTCLDEFAHTYLGMSAEEKEAYTAAREKMHADLDAYIDPQRGPASDPGPYGILSQTRKEDGTEVRLSTRLARTRLEEALARRNVIKPTLRPGACRWIVMMEPAGPTRRLDESSMMEGAFLQYLSKRKWEVVSTEGMANMQKPRNATDDREAEAARIAMLSDVDVMIRYEAMKRRGQQHGGTIAWILKLKAYDPNGRMLGAETVTSKSRLDRPGESNRAMNDAALDVMLRLEPQILDYCQDAVEHGDRMSIRLTGVPGNAVVPLGAVLEKRCVRQKIQHESGVLQGFCQTKVPAHEIAWALDKVLKKSRPPLELNVMEQTRFRLEGKITRAY